MFLSHASADTRYVLGGAAQRFVLLANSDVYRRPVKVAQAEARFSKLHPLNSAFK